MNASKAQSKLSPGCGLVHPRGWRRLLPAESTRERPAPTWMPLTMGVGMTLVNHLSSPVILNMKTTPAVVNPAETVSSIVNFLAIATAAIALYSLAVVLLLLVGAETNLHWLYR